METAETFGVDRGIVQRVSQGIKCNTKRDEAMKAYKANGHSMSEVAERFGVSKKIAEAVCKGIAPQTMRRPEQYRNQWTDKDQTERVKAVIAEKTPGFEYAGNYTGSDGFADLKCKACGHIQTRSWVSVRHGTATCDMCEQKRLEEQRQKRNTFEEARQETRQKRAAAIAWSRYEKSIKQQVFAICKECGTLFVAQGNRAYCSAECSRRHDNNHRDRRLKGVKKDYSITLRKVYEKDAGVCYLCGGMCDWDDIETRDDGTMVAGDRYPSIDHVYPISLGGTHTWDNVRLAHRWCNTVKSAIPQGS